MERWAPIPGFTGYEISDHGRVLSRKSKIPRILSTSYNRDGYVRVFLWRENRVYTRYVHVMVASAFIGPRPKGLDVCHFDDDKDNNAADNLRYDTRSRNIHDAVRNKTQNQARKTHCPRGHAYDESNTMVRKTGWRTCRSCQNARQAVIRAARRSAA